VSNQESGKQKKCVVCQTLIPSGAKECPQCGYTINRWYKKWWGILIIAMIVFGVVGALVNPGSAAKSNSHSQQSTSIESNSSGPAGSTATAASGSSSGVKK